MVTPTKQDRRSKLRLKSKIGSLMVPLPLRCTIYYIVGLKNKNIMTTASRNVAELEIGDIEGIGPTTARKMKEAGISSVMELATAIPEELATDLGGSKETAATFILAAQKLL